MKKCRDKFVAQDKKIQKGDISAYEKVILASVDHVVNSEFEAYTSLRAVLYHMVSTKLLNFHKHWKSLNSYDKFL